MDIYPFDSNRYFYHYTRFCSGIKILNSMCLLFHKLKDMNDINELYRPLYFEDLKDKERTKRELSHLQQISLTQDGRLRGFNIPAMWGHYGEEGNGVCLILEKEKLLNSLESVTTYRSPISYEDDYSPDIHVRLVEGENSPFSESEIMDYFFKKTYDWSYEQEYRIIRRSDDDELLKLDISNSFAGVIMHRDKNMKDDDDSVFNSDNYKLLSNIVGHKKVFVYEYGLHQNILVNREEWELWNTENKPYGEVYMKIS